ncbi:MAG TPA: cytochrome P450 [Roseiarcus sp.]|nr:cytochrome P450 [Roseiarcus sp.]
MPPLGAPASDIDPFSLEFFADPFPAHQRLRDAGPAVWLRKYGVWAVARYEEVSRVLNDWRTFCSSRGVGLSDFAKEKPWRPASLVLEKDPPEHDRARAVLNRALSAGVMKQLRDRLAAAAEALTQRLVEKRSFDAIPELAEAYPLSVFPDAMGLRQEGREHLLPYAGTVFNAFGPDNELRRNAIQRAAPHIAWVTEQCQRENLSADGIGATVHAAVDAGEITAEEAPLLVRSLLSAGIDTTVNALGAAIYCLARFPSEMAKLHADPALARSAFEEAIRYESPVQTFFRTTTRSVEIGDVRLGEGEKILMLLAAANRDPRKWDNAETYDIERRTSGHVGYGAGVHLCVGQLLARVEGEAVLSALARRVREIRIVGEPKRAFNNTLRGLESLPVELVTA